ncbi:MAG: hypothetical protein PHE80_00950 [Candidatus Omnitrophica bacterium]|nr:hypothetical protein [Candidatus Omnitrophota bacterium]MDD5737178.1 hypothetical protein [Candidatus Omnitrophota bacterium]
MSGTFVYLITVSRIIPSFISIILALNRDYVIAAIALIFAVWLDSLVVLAKKGRAHKIEFQLQLEGFVDFFSFIISPAIFLLMAEYGFLPVIAAFIFVVSGIWRISRFNAEGLLGGYYRGLPVTYNGYIVPLAYFSVSILNLNAYQGLIFSVIMMLSAVLMVSPIKIKEMG